MEEKWRTSYIKSELIGGVSPRHLNMLLFIIIIFIVVVVAVDYTHQHMLRIVAIVDCTHIGSATAFFEVLVTLHRRTLQQIF